MGVVDVEAGAVGEDDVGEAEVFVGELGGVGDLAGEVEAAGVAEGFSSSKSQRALRARAADAAR